MKTTHIFILLLTCCMLVLASCSSTQSAASRNSTKTKTTAGSDRTANNDRMQQLLERMEPGKAREYFIQGSILQMQKRYAEAIIEFQQALRYDNSPALYYALALNYRELSKPDLAIEHLRNALAVDIGFIPAHHLLGEIYISQFRLDEAIEVYEHLMQTEPTDIVRFTLARMYEFRDIDKALQMYQDMLEDHEDYTVLERLADIYENRGDTAQSIAILERLYRLVPDNESIPPILLQRYLQTNDYEHGFELLEHIDNALPSRQVQRYYLAVGSTLLRDMATAPTTTSGFAAQYISRTEGIFPDAWQIHLLRGMLAGELGDTSLADRLFSSTLQNADSIPEVPLQVITFHMQKQRYDAMANVTKHYEERFTDDPRFPFFAALALSRQQQSAEAIKALQRALSVDSTYVEAWTQLGIEYSIADQPILSDSAYRRAIELEPDNALANNNYAYSLSERGEKLALARQMAETALEKEPNNPSYLDTMGWIYYQLGDYEKALEFISKAIANGDASATVYEHLGDVYNKLGESEEAERAWRKSQNIEPGRQSIRERLNTLR